MCLGFDSYSTQMKERQTPKQPSSMAMVIDQQRQLLIEQDARLRDVLIERAQDKQEIAELKEFRAILQDRVKELQQEVAELKEYKAIRQDEDREEENRLAPWEEDEPPM